VNEFNVVVAARKFFTFNTPDGEEVLPTENPQFFFKKDGTVLKKVGYCQTNNCLMFHSGRQSQ
jgi:flagellar basal body rod protein FlgG